jgi:tetratricopeptide (TPR) repeat protein
MSKRKRGLHVAGPSRRVRGEGDSKPGFNPTAAFERLLKRILGGKPFTSLEEANRFLEQMREQMMQSFPNLEPPPRDAVEALLFDAEMAEDPEEAVRAYERVLEQDPANPEALVELAALEQEPAKAIALLERAAASAEQRLGPAFFDDPGKHRDNPLAGVLVGAYGLLGERLRFERRHEEALQRFLSAVRLDPDDSLKDAVIGEMMATGGWSDARDLLPDREQSTFALFAAALCEHKLGNPAQAARLLKKARRANGYVAGYLLGRLPLPDEPSSNDAPGSTGEAHWCIYRLAGALDEQPEAGEWLISQLAR